MNCNLRPERVHPRHSFKEAHGEGDCGSVKLYAGGIGSDCFGYIWAIAPAIAAAMLIHLQHFPALSPEKAPNTISRVALGIRENSYQFCSTPPLFFLPAVTPHSSEGIVSHSSLQLLRIVDHCSTAQTLAALAFSRLSPPFASTSNVFAQFLQFPRRHRRK